MTFLSSGSLNLFDRQVRRDLGDRQNLHCTLMHAFPPSPMKSEIRKAYGVLYRLEADRRGHPMILLQSSERPDWTQLPACYWKAPPQSKQIDSQLESLDAGRVLSFRLLANPTRRSTGRRPGEDGAGGKQWAGKLIELTSEEDQLTWLTAQGARKGFELAPVSGWTVPDVRISATGKLFGQGDKRARMSFGIVQFDGHLRIVDREAFHSALAEGVGRAKAYGCGLLSIGPPRV